MKQSVPVWRRVLVRSINVLLVALLGGAVVSVGALAIAQRSSDGPLNAMIPGGPLQSGEWVTEPVQNWSEVLGGAGACDGADCPSMEPIELQLVEPAHTRYVGIMVRDGELFIPCDLGFMWNRFEGRQRNILRLIYMFKSWHEDALRDGRVVLRIDGKRYALQAVRVTDAEQVAALKGQLEDMARAWVAPEELGPVPTRKPNDIWFFRLDPRSAGTSLARSGNIRSISGPAVIEMGGHLF